MLANAHDPNWLLEDVVSTIRAKQGSHYHELSFAFMHHLLTGYARGNMSSTLETCALPAEILALQRVYRYITKIKSISNNQLSPLRMLDASNKESREQNSLMRLDIDI